MIRKTFLALAALAGMTAADAANPYGLPDNIQDGNILHLFDWNISDIRAELPAIAEAGFGAIQLSPIQGNAADNAEWFYAYLPYDMKIMSGGVGSKPTLTALCQEAEGYGIKVIVDVVANHVNGSSSHRASKWNNTAYWHSTNFKGINYGVRSSITHDNLGDYPDLNSEHADVQAAVKTYVEELKAAGVKGIRWDAAKHIGLPSEGCAFWSTVTSVPGLWHYGELLDSPGGDENALVPEYMKYMSITDNRYCNTVLDDVRAGRATTSFGAYTARGLSASKLVYWAESHDTYANDNGATKYVPQAVIDRAWAINACRQGAAALYLSRPFETSRTAIRVGVKGSEAFKAKHIAAVNKLRNAMGDTPEYLASADGVTVVTRAGGGACIVVGNGQGRSVSVPNGGGYLPAGTYRDLVSGNTFTATATTISGTVGSTGIAVVYDENAINAPRIELSPSGTSFDTPTFTVTATLVNAERGSVSVDGGAEIAVSASGTPVVIGECIRKGTITLRWTATAGSETRQGTATYTKIDPDETPADMPSSFYIIGEVGGGTWSPSKGVEMKAEGPRFTATTRIGGYFSFAKSLASNWNELNADGNRWGVAADVTASLGQEVTLVQLNDPKAISMTGTVKTKEYTVTVNWSTKTMTVTEPAGIEGVEVEEADVPAEYYTLDGRRVENPSAGLYIVRRGTKVTKTYIR